MLKSLFALVLALAAVEAVAGEKFTHLTATGKQLLPPPTIEGYWTYPYKDDFNSEDVWVRASVIENGKRLALHFGDDPKFHPELNPGDRHPKGDNPDGLVGEFGLATDRCFKGLLDTIERRRAGAPPKCPQWAWWQQASFCMDEASRFIKFTTRVDGFETEGTKCEKTKTPDVFDVPFERYIGATWVPLPSRPDKWLYFIGTPAAGSNPAQYKGTARFTWDYAAAVKNAGTDFLQIVARLGDLSSVGKYRVFTTQQLLGAHDFVVTAAGRYQILLEVQNKRGQVVHTDHVVVDFPRIPGVN